LTIRLIQIFYANMKIFISCLKNIWWWIKS
jgi:hypothetical protein